ncbi:MAG: hypothetical protein ACREIA_05580 [Opitutaceae bacterium]
MRAEERYELRRAKRLLAGTNLSLLDAVKLALVAHGDGGNAGEAFGDD